MSVIYTRTYEPPSIDRKEILRYAGVRGEDPALSALLAECLGELEGMLTYKVCYRSFSVTPTEDGLSLGFTVTRSRDLQKNLMGCHGLVVFAATVGIGLDRMIARASAVSPAKALLLQAIGAERIESLCDRFCGELADGAAAEGKGTRPRFSPGYGDLPLETQREIFAVLDCPRRIGLSLNGSLLMSPSKSVTAIVGISEGGRGVSGSEPREKTNREDRREA